MILLDTNVISALMQREVDEVVVAWLDTQPPESIWTTSITVFEVRFGLELLANGRRRRLLEEAFRKMLEEDFEGRVVPFDEAAADAAGRIAAERRGAGEPSRFVTCRSPGSRRRARRRSRRATCATSKGSVRK